ncbi:MAG: tRNA 2-thiouridine(34) synthase MnmA [Blastochloris sp.]|nr:tRNA 2-thiouridine(34) synthase MnmA [Blastochloris sp.]
MKVLVGLSGGVDSSVAAALLLRQGHAVTGAYMKNWINEENIAGHCPWMQDIEDARAVAERLGIEFRVVNLMKEYRERIVNTMLAGYEEGITPNPDVMCNREMKFGVFLDYALKEGFDRVATGHYVRGGEHGGRACLWEGADRNKDQSYFLALLRQEQIQRGLFPVGELQKSEVRSLAEAQGLVTATKKDSQGICFIGEVKMSDFLKAFIPDKPGPIVDLEGKRLGEHRGLHLYTLGQRKGIRVPSNTEGQAYVVVAKRREGNELVIAFDQAGTPGLYARRASLHSLSWCGEELGGELQVEAKPRYRAVRSPVGLKVGDEGRAEVIFEQAQRALAPGQICALYQGERLLGGGVFAEILG